MNALTAPFRHGIDGVANQIDKHLMKFPWKARTSAFSSQHRVDLNAMQCSVTLKYSQDRLQKRNHLDPGDAFRITVEAKRVGGKGEN